jgi:hypothetical protein
MTDVTESGTAWLSREEMGAAREWLPIRYVDAVPVRVDEQGIVTAVGLLLCIGENGRSSGRWCRGGCRRGWW